MTLNRIAGSGLNQPHKIGQYSKTLEQRRPGHHDLGNVEPSPEKSVPQGDLADISPQARRHLERHRLIHAGLIALEQTPDVRAGKLAQVRRRLADGFYRSTEVRDQVARRLGELFSEQGLF